MRLLDEQDGQGMAEFALVLPMLALLTFGTIEVAIYLQQQSTLNAATFMAVRSASVLGNQGQPVKSSTEQFANAAGGAWLHDAVGGMKGTSKGQNDVGYELTAKTDALAGMISILSNNEAKGLDKLSAKMTFPLEYDSRKFKQNKPTSVPRSMSLFSYDATQWIKGNNPVTTAGTKFQEAKDKLKTVAKVFKVALPTPKPTAAPTKPNSGGGGDRPQPKVIETPHPHSSALPNGGKPFELRVPHVAEVMAFTVSAGEPFQTVGAVIANPKHRNDAGDGNQLTSSDYLAPLFERHFRKTEPTMFGGKDPTYRIQNLLESLDAYSKQLGQQQQQGQAGKVSGLYSDCNAVGSLPTTHAPPELIPPGTPPEMAQAINTAWVTTVVPLLVPARQAGSKVAAGMVTTTESAYKAQLQAEQRLFKP